MPSVKFLHSGGGGAWLLTKNAGCELLVWIWTKVSRAKMNHIAKKTKKAPMMMTDDPQIRSGQIEKSAQAKTKKQLQAGTKTIGDLAT